MATLLTARLLPCLGSQTHPLRARSSVWSMTCRTMAELLTSADASSTCRRQGANQYDEERTLLLEDWFHTQGDVLLMQVNRCDRLAGIFVA